MKKFILFSIAIVLVTITIAQTVKKVREKKIEDIVMQLPADNTENFNRLMSELIGLGDVIDILAPRLVDSGDDDRQIRYAISGLAMYASKDASMKKPVSLSICKAIPKVKSDEIRDFLFIQLQYVAGDESVETAVQYLNNARLADAAVRVLKHIGGETAKKAIYGVSDVEKDEGFVPMFNGIDMSGWTGNVTDYFPLDGAIVCDPTRGGSGNLYTEKEYSDFIMRFEFLLTPAANNGIGIRTPLTGDAAYVGMELQVLDNEAELYRHLEKYQYHGSVYGVIPAKRGFLKPAGEWNYQEIIADGNHIKITLNGAVILDGNIAEASKNFTETIDGFPHPGLSNKSGHIGFLGHGSWVSFRNLRIKDLSKTSK